MSRIKMIIIAEFPGEGYDASDILHLFFEIRNG